MAEEYGFFNSVNGDRKYDMEQFATYFKQFLSNGIYHTNNVPALRVSHVSGMQTKLEPGSAYIEGYMYRNTEDIIFTHEAADPTNTRIDRIVLRLDRSVNARYIKAFVKKGTPATNPQPPALQRDDIVYEISLAQVRIEAGKTTISSVKDERLDPNVAGLVSSLITVPTEQFLDEWNSWMAEMNEKKEDYQAAWESWFNGIQNQIGVRLLTGSSEPSGAVAGDIWLKTV
ncbi:hypothetical protein [Geobacillus kaustophilus]|uniref:Phage-related protein n=1 Tax=Geobacillus kaustophilus (strain HTA426) TaxID=235909 RepID=Q5L2K4_GEOKA|nr:MULTISPECIES: hypothetical protein [Geobacillus thermoleovorans group]MBW7642412.1 hypothetical protein [Geobacillus thermoleovorans]BAD74826.1 phage-related protein [Geobacillus kaustophilus HTA426]